MTTAREYWDANNDGDTAELIAMTPGKLGYQDPDLWLEEHNGALHVCDDGGSAIIGAHEDIWDAVREWKAATK